MEEIYSRHTVGRVKKQLFFSWGIRYVGSHFPQAPQTEQAKKSKEKKFARKFYNLYLHVFVSISPLRLATDHRSNGPYRDPCGPKTKRGIRTGWSALLVGACLKTPMSLRLHFSLLQADRVPANLLRFRFNLFLQFQPQLSI